MTSLRILYVAYPLLPVTPESCGGAEQVLLAVEREMHARGHRTVVAAAQGSQVAGELYATGAPASAADAFERRDREHNRRVLQLLAHDADFDLVHDMSGTFWKCAAEIDAPLLATLHLPPSLYAGEMWETLSLNRYFNCVSAAQARSFGHLPRRLGVVENGIDLTRFAPAPGRRSHLLWMGRICEEKGPHVALDVAAAAGLPLLLAGSVYPFSYHRQYFAREIVPRLARRPGARWVEAPSLQEKLELLRGARALLIPSLIDETSSLAAMEAMACGTPVIAFRRGALPEVVEDGVTGFVVDSTEEMVKAIARVGRISPAACRQRIEQRFSVARMSDGYERLYEHVLANRIGERSAA